MKYLSLFPVIFLLLHLPLLSQISEGDSLLRAGIRQIDDGQFEEAWETLETGRKKYSEHTVFQYEQAYLRTAQKRYKEAVELMEEIIDAPDSYDKYYQMLGNAYDLSGDAEKAIRTYTKGLEKYPESGVLHLELGVMSAQKEEYDQALEFWEKGLTYQPDFSSNYFHAARMFMLTTERGWGQLYGEIFLNMEPGSQRASAMRGMLWQSYNEAVTLSSEEVPEKEKEERVESKMSFSYEFFKDVTILFDPETEEMMLPFSFFFTKAGAVAGTAAFLTAEPITVAGVHTFRSVFLDQWYQDTIASEHFSIPLYDYQRRLKEAGLLEAYDHYLFFCEETADEVKAWFGEHPGKIDELAEWMTANPYPTDKKHAFSRLKTDGIPMRDLGDFGSEMEIDEE